ncbi:MAG TPA: hypothetical protein VGH21_06905 [Solirubrobacteraceae bacterium]|jgi:hypothetical protein
MLNSPRVRVLFTASLASLLALLCASAALAAGVTVNLRVEGSSTTLFEGPVTTSPETFETASSGGAHPCDYASNGPSEGFANEGVTAGTPTTALHDAALTGGLAFDAEWFGSGVSNGNPGDFFVTKVGPDANGGPPTFPSWGYAVNYTTANVGGCQIALSPGTDVLWAYNYFNLAHLLALTGPASVNAGTPFTVHVADGRTGEPIAGAGIGTFAGGAVSTLDGSSQTDASGNATLTLASAGTVALKATQSESVRSNAISVCVHAGADGNCGANTVAESLPLVVGPKLPGSAPKASALSARVLGVSNGHVYSRRAAPRLLRGTVKVAAGGTLRQVRIRLQRRVGRHCLNFSGTRERFVCARKCSAAAFFSVGDGESFSYLLPKPLPAGRYTFDVDAIEASGGVTGLVGGVNHVVFRVK